MYEGVYGSDDIEYPPGDYKWVSVPAHRGKTYGNGRQVKYNSARLKRAVYYVHQAIKFNYKTQRNK